MATPKYQYNSTGLQYALPGFIYNGPLTAYSVDLPANTVVFTPDLGAN